MTWAGGRRLLVVSSIGAVIVAVLALIFFATLYQAPSCTDQTQNQGETGVDCGGPCPYLCSVGEQAPVVRFTQAVVPATDRTDIIAYVDNPNVDAAARSVPYKITLYGADHTVLKTGVGTLDLPPASTVPVFVPAFFSGSAEGAQAFLTIDSANIRWFSLARAPYAPSVSDPALGGTLGAPRVTGTLSNETTNPLSRTTVIVAIFDSSGNVMAASQTVIPTIPAQGSASASFTWNSAFPRTTARIDIVPLVTLSP